jgi:hypothetical protein
MKPFIMKSAPLSRYFLLLCPNIVVRSLLSKTLSLYSSLNFKDQVSHPYKTTGKITILYISIFMFLNSKRQDRRFWTK